MEDIVVGILFIYPGAIIELLYRRYAKYGYKEESHAEPIKLAELFLNSAIVTILTVILLRAFTSIQADSLNSLVFELNRFGSLMQYLILSVAVTCIVAWVRYKASGMDPEGDGPLDQQRVNGCRVAGSADTWRELIYGPDLKEILEYCILRISNGSTESAGFALYFPNDFEQGIVLTQTSIVEDTLKNEVDAAHEKCFVGRPCAVFIDPNSGTKVEFFNGKKLHDYLASED